MALLHCCALSVPMFRCTCFCTRKDYGFLFSNGHAIIDLLKMQHANLPCLHRCCRHPGVPATHLLLCTSATHLRLASIHQCHPEETMISVLLLSQLPAGPLCPDRPALKHSSTLTSCACCLAGCCKPLQRQRWSGSLACCGASGRPTGAPDRRGWPLHRTTNS